MLACLLASPPLLSLLGQALLSLSPSLSLSLPSPCARVGWLAVFFANSATETRYIFRQPPPRIPLGLDPRGVFNGVTRVCPWLGSSTCSSLQLVNCLVIALETFIGWCDRKRLKQRLKQSDEASLVAVDRYVNRQDGSSATGRIAFALRRDCIVNPACVLCHDSACPVFSLFVELFFQENTIRDRVSLEQFSFVESHDVGC